MNQEPARPIRETFPIDQLQVGDLLLMLGKSELSKLIAWFGDSRYSHVSMVSENGMLIEGIRPVASESPLAKRLAAGGPVVYVDAFRSLSPDGSPLSAADRAAVLGHARSLLGTTFAQDELVMVGLLVALRGKPKHLPPWLRWVILRATEHAIRQDPHKMMCSEFAYRSFADCDVSPAGRLARPITHGTPSDLPFPQVDYAKLEQEVREILGLKGPAAEALGHHDAIGAAMAADVLGDPAVDGAALDDAIAALRMQLGLQATSDGTARGENNALMAGEPSEKSGAQEAAALAGAGGPNPKLVRPRDLADSVASRYLGALK